MQIATNCTGGVVDSQQQCCISGLLDRQGTCCGKGSSLDGAGWCCPGGVLDACGVCNGAGQTVDVEGVCCNSTLDAAGVCCQVSMLFTPHCAGVAPVGLCHFTIAGGQECCCQACKAYPAVPLIAKVDLQASQTAASRHDAVGLHQCVILSLSSLCLCTMSVKQAL